MPVIQIKSLPFNEPKDIGKLIQAVSVDFARDAAVALKYVSVTWELLPPDSYAVAATTQAEQPRSTHPILVELLTPDFNTNDQISLMLESLAQAIARHAGVRLENIFIVQHAAKSGRIFDSGKILRW
ncbi:MAG: hypothetical protein ACFCUJ_00225 [Thiotrichales bacterium]